MKKIYSPLKIKELGSEITIQGYANHYSIDEQKDLILPDSWDLSRYLKNPIVLFNHDMSYPIGKSSKVTPTENGLYCEVVLSNSDTEKIKYVRDLVKDGILNSFSVGFDPKDSKVEGEVNKITSARLHEISIVALPMNEDSLFNLKKFTIKSYDNYKELKMTLLKQKGAMAAAALSDEIGKAVDAGSSKQEILDQVCGIAKCTSEELSAILAGEKTPIPEAVLQAFTQVLNIPYEPLDELNKEDLSEINIDENSTPPEEKSLEEKCEDMEKEIEDVTQTPFQKCISESIPKYLEEGYSQEDAATEAMKSCSEKGLCEIKDITKEDIEYALNVKSDGPTVDLNATAPDTTTKIPLIEISQQQVALLGSISTKLDEQMKVFTEILNLLKKDEVEDSQEEMGMDSEKPLEEPTLEDSLMPKSIVIPKTISVKKLTKLENLEKTLDNLEKQLNFLGDLS